MKTLFSVLFVLMPFIAFSWDIDTVSNDETTGRKTACVVDSNDELHLIWINPTNVAPDYEEQLWYGHDDDGDGDVEASEIEELVDGVCEGSIGLDSNDYPHIVFRTDSNNGIDCCYIYYDGSDWSDVIDIATTGYVGFSCDIAVDSDDNIHFVYDDESNDDVVYAYKNGNTLVTSIISNYDTGDPAIDCYGTVPHVVYRNVSGAQRGLYYAEKTGLSWSKVKIDDEDEYAVNPTIAVDSNGDNHISVWRVFQVGQSMGVQYYSDCSGSWSSEIVDSQAYWLGYFCGTTNEIAVDTQDMPHISFYEWYTNDMRHAWKDTTQMGWQKEDVETSYCCGLYSSISVDDDDDIYITYWKCKVPEPHDEWCRFAFKSWTAPNMCESPFVSPTAHSTTNTLSVSYLTDYQGGCFCVSNEGEPINGPVIIKVYDMAGRRVDSLHVETAAENKIYVPWTSSRVTTGTYLFTVETRNLSASGSLSVVR